MDPRTPTRLLLGAVAVLLVAGIVALAMVDPNDESLSRPGRSASERLPGGKASSKAKPPPPLRNVSIYHGLGAWIDVFDFVPAYYRPAEGPLLVPDDLESLAQRGVRTVFLQAARLDERSPGGIVDPVLVGRFLEGARRRGMRVVGWYLPKFGDIEADLANLRQIRDFQFEGHRFDGVGVDIEFRGAVRDDGERNRRLIELSRRLRQESGNEALAAIVLAPVLLEVVHPGYWPNFPWSELGQLYDVWLPMTYWTDVKGRTGYRDGLRFTAESIARLRNNLGNPSALVHPIGGVANLATDDDYRRFVQAAKENGAFGLSMYDFRTTSPGGWAVLEGAAPAS